MSFRVKFRPEAEKDLVESAKWYEEQRDNLGFDFMDEVEKNST